MPDQAGRKKTTARLAGAASALVAAACSLAMLAPASASAAPAARHHGVKVITLGKWKKYHHHHGRQNEPPNCHGRIYSEIDGSRLVFIWDRKTYFSDGPAGPGGGMISGSVKKTATISASISASATISIDALISDASVTVSGRVTKSDSTTLGNDTSFKIPPHKWGNLEYGTKGYQLKWSKWKETPTCQSIPLGHGTGMVPTVASSWHYWSSRH